MDDLAKKIALGRNTEVDRIIVRGGSKEFLKATEGKEFFHIKKVKMRRE